MSESDSDNDNDNSGNGADSQTATPVAADAGEKTDKVDVPPPPETVEAQAQRLDREKRELHDRLLRLAAEFENYKKRARKEQEEAGTRAREGLLKEVLPVIDNLERALNAAAGTSSPLVDGVRLVDKQMLGVLEKFGVKRFEALGESFDPNRHDAIQQIETTATPPGTVAQVFARGYFLGDRLLRPAMVAVAKAPASAEPEGAEQADPEAGPDDVIH